MFSIEALSYGIDTLMTTRNSASIIFRKIEIEVLLTQSLSSDSINSQIEIALRIWKKFTPIWTINVNKRKLIAWHTTIDSLWEALKSTESSNNMVSIPLYSRLNSRASAKTSHTRMVAKFMNLGLSSWALTKNYSGKARNSGVMSIREYTKCS